MITPYNKSKESKKEQVERMFNNIAHRYDFLNHFLSIGIDRLWREKAISCLLDKKPGLILDIATGTADMAIMTAKQLVNAKIIGTDISGNMLAVGEKKIKKAGLSGRIDLKKADSIDLPFGDHTFDAAMVAFGVRNFEDLEKCLKEIYRVLKPGAVFAVLEFSKPRFFPFRQVYEFYFKRILPLLAGFFVNDNIAYKYLPASVMQFPERDDFIRCLRKAGFSECSYKSLTFGIASVYKTFK